MSFERPRPIPLKAAVRRAAEAAQYRRLLDELREVSIDLVGQIGRVVTGRNGSATPAEVTSMDYVIAFERGSRAVRNSIQLELRMGDPPSPAPEVSGLIRIILRRLVIKAIDEAILRGPQGKRARSVDHDDLDELEGLEELEAEELIEEDEEELEDIGDRPTAAVMADICRDLGLAAQPGVHPWQRHARADVEGLCVRAAGYRAAGELLPFPARNRGK